MKEVKDFAFFNRKLLELFEGKIIIPKKVGERIGKDFGRNLRRAEVFGKEVLVYVF